MRIRTAAGITAGAIVIYTGWAYLGQKLKERHAMEQVMFRMYFQASPDHPKADEIVEEKFTLWAIAISETPLGFFRWVLIDNFNRAMGSVRYFHVPTSGQKWEDYLPLEERI